MEETPAPCLDQAQRESLWESAKKLAEHVKYRSAGTIEFLFDEESAQFYFLEVNARLQVWTLPLSAHGMECGALLRS